MGRKRTIPSDSHLRREYCKNEGTRDELVSSSRRVVYIFWRPFSRNVRFMSSLIVGNSTFVDGILNFRRLPHHCDNSFGRFHLRPILMLDFGHFAKTIHACAFLLDMYLWVNSSKNDLCGRISRDAHDAAPRAARPRISFHGVMVIRVPSIHLKSSTCTFVMSRLAARDLGHVNMSRLKKTSLDFVHNVIFRRKY